MKRKQFEELTQGNYCLDEKAMESCKGHWNKVAKPLFSLGTFEKHLIQIAGITGSPEVTLEKKAIVVMCSDNGVVEEGVTQTDQSVTAIVAGHIALGKGNINILARCSGAKVIAVDVGMNTVFDKGLLNLKVAKGTGNIAKGPAMTTDQAIQAIMAGIDLMKELKEEGYAIVGTGEMGIGNTTTSSAMASIMLKLPVMELTGPGAGLSKEGVRHKIQVIEQALAVNVPDPSDPIEILSKVGGFDIAGITGLFLGGMIYHLPVVVDGIISAVAALTACRINPSAVNFMLASHQGREKACEYILKELGLTPVLYGDLALGEGSGTAFLFPLLDMAEAVYRNSPTFSGMKIEAYEDLKKEGSE